MLPALVGSKHILAAPEIRAQSPKSDRTTERQQTVKGQVTLAGYVPAGDERHSSHGGGTSRLHRFMDMLNHAAGSLFEGQMGMGVLAVNPRSYGSCRRQTRSWAG
jgi:hypothetical protein